MKDKLKFYFVAVTKTIARYVRKGLRYIINTAVSSLPRDMRHNIYRNFVFVPQRVPENLTFKIAETKGELEEAFRLLHDSYLDNKLIEPEESGLRVTLFHALPSTTTIIAKDGDTVIGTISIVRSGQFGLPSDRLGYACFARMPHQRVAEISALAINKAYRGKLLLPMLKFMYHVCRHRLGIECIVAVVSARKRSADFYEALLGFERWIKEPVAYKAFNDDIAVALYLDLEEAFFKFARLYAHKKPEKDLFTFFVRRELPNFNLPNKEYFEINNPVMTPELLDYFFNKKTNTFSNLTHEEVGKLYATFQRKEFRKVLPSWVIEKRDQPRERFEVQCDGQIIDDGQSILVQMIEASTHGCRIKTKEGQLAVDHTYQFTFRVSEFENVKVTGHVEWYKNSVYGVHITQSDEGWSKFITSLTSHHYAA